MIALYQGRSLGSRLIRWWTFGKYSHAAWVCRDGSVIESTMKTGVHELASLDDSHTDGTPVEVYTLPISDRQYAEIDAAMRAEIGKKYDWKAILGFALHARLEQRMAWFCSELVVGVLNKCGIFPLKHIEPFQVSPTFLSWSPFLKLAVKFKTRKADSHEKNPECHAPTVQCPVVVQLRNSVAGAT